MTHAKHAAGGHDLAKAVGYWLRMEEENRELKTRIASALDDVKGFVEKHRSDLERRKSKLIQTSGFKDETRGMEAALANIHRLLAGGRNISHIFSAIDGFLQSYKADDTFAREHTRGLLADAREDFQCAFQDSVRGTRLCELLDILYFLPYSCWRSRGMERRNFRSPAAAEVLRVLEELRQRGVDVDTADPVQLAAVIRIKLGITPRMDYHLMPANKLAERLTGEENIARFASREVPLDPAFWHTAGGILANIRRWSDECFGRRPLPAPAEIEAEMLQIVFLAAETIRISGTERERAADYLWLLSTVVGGARSPLRDALPELAEKKAGRASLHKRVTAARCYLDETAVLADRILVARWSEAREALTSLIARAEALASKSTRELGELTELDQLKERRSDVVKSLIKISDSLLLLEPSLLELVTSPAAAALAPPAGEYLRGLEPAALKARNARSAEETKSIARQELEKLRLLIARMTELSRAGLVESAAQPERERGRAGQGPARRTADGTELGALSAAELGAKLRGLLLEVARSVREFKAKIEGVRKRSFKPDLQHALQVLQDKVGTAAAGCDNADLDGLGPDQAHAVAGRVVPLLGDIMSAQAKVGTRLNSAKLTPAEKHPLLALLHAAKTWIGDDLRDIERIRAELVERSAGAHAGSEEAARTAPDDATAGEAAAAEAALPGGAPDDAAPAAPAQVVQVSAAARMAGLAAAANSALKPVNALLVGLRRALSSGTRDDRAIHAAAQALRRGVTEARDLVTWNLMQLEAIAGDAALQADEHVENFGRWHGQLLALGRETDRLSEAAEALGPLETAFQTAGALEKEIADSFNALSLQEIRIDDLVPLRERCATALGMIAALVGQVRQAQDRLAAAARTEWRILKTASGYLDRRQSDLAGFDTELSGRRARIERTRRLVEIELGRTR